MEQSFIASNRIVRLKLGVKAADILAVLIYKKAYWNSQEKLNSVSHKGTFFISLNDLRAETMYSTKLISDAINVLKEAGLVYTIRQGLNKPNRYLIDEEVIDNYIKEHTGELEQWQQNIRDHKGNRRISQKSTSGTTKKGTQDVIKEDTTKNKNTKKGTQDVIKEDTTKNKNTKNKITKNKILTNRASWEKPIDLESDLETKINNLRQGDDKAVISLFNFLCSLVNSFGTFKMSDDDEKLILKIVESEISEYKLSDKIISNASDITKGRKEARFGNLFVGVSEMVANYNEAIV
jgi:DNA-binding transcriptional regulator GbsR (MarR family)